MVSGLITGFPIGDDEALHWWRVVDDVIVARGQDIALAEAASFDPAAPVIALVPASLTTIDWQEMGDLAPRQAEGAARLQAAEMRIGGDATNHIAAKYADRDSAVLTATISTATMAHGLAELQRAGLDPDVVTPVSLIIPAPDAGFVTAEIGAEPILRGDRFAMPDDPDLRTAIIGNADVAALGTHAADAALIAALDAVPINLRSGNFAKRRRLIAVGPLQRRVLAMLTAGLLLVTLLIYLIAYLRIENAADAQDAEALARAQTVVPEAADLATAERLIDQRLVQAGRGGIAFSSPLAALLGAMKDAPGLSLRDLNYRPDGTLAAVIAGPRAENINPALLAIQASGYKITANSRSDSTGAVVADLTVRAP
ncbi:MAG: type II secretion system protein GspL [Parasphingorhabdus sp.]|nr:type II secretion system protein GspL [Parasphingorhabdus sp.]